ncbi:hypothetical protein NECAME_07413 [Necator americanus]|uniref:Reverse transcriptase domain-containing protein n=1 Tax=Necator americanus TaxID=51031 RepID=W2TNZ8_NECAM|nr:hypothetical protein NECAME_07413 [Necator americanus]ETN83404.1 hypothetical protein NECAME_07413 [Necator americanus]
MKSNKATGPDDIPADLWKLLGDRVPVWLATLFNKIVAEGRTPDAYTTAVPYDEVFERVLEARLRKIVSVSLNQCGFVKDCSTINAIHAVLLEEHREKNRSVHLAFLDL